MFLWKKNGKSRMSGPARLPSYVRNVNSAQCLFCPYGTDVKAGDRVLAWDEKTVFGREPRERLVEITAVKVFRTNGRVVTLDFVVASDKEVARIAEDSEIAGHMLLTHRSGTSTYDMKKPPVVVYFRPYEQKDTALQLVPDLDITAARPSHRAPVRNRRYETPMNRLVGWLTDWVRKSRVF
ncbi:MAG: hypothetical protein WBR15_08995 [Gammaproteobacteria bacterium]